MKTLENGKTYEYLTEGRIFVYAWDKDDALINEDWDRVPAGTMFTVVETPWTPPNRPEVVEVRVLTKAPLPWVPGEVNRVLSVGMTLLHIGAVREVATNGDLVYGVVTIADQALVTASVHATEQKTSHGKKVNDDH